VSRLRLDLVHGKAPFPLKDWQAPGRIHITRLNPAILVFGLFSGSTATGLDNCCPPPDNVFNALRDSKSVDSLDMRPSDNYAHRHDTNRLANIPVLNCGPMSICDVFPGNITVYIYAMSMLRHEPSSFHSATFRVNKATQRIPQKRPLHHFMPLDCYD
jgi:hypothetical protein